MPFFGHKTTKRIAYSRVKEQKKIRNIRKDVVTGKLGEEILEVIQKAVKIPPSAYVKPEHEKMLPVGAAALYELLRLLLKIRSQEQGVIPRLIASDDDLKRLAVFSDRKNPVLRGWRFEIFGRDAVALREGKLSISYDAEHHRIEIGEKAGN